jgi:flavodoxin
VKKLARRILYVIFYVLVIWGVLTLLAEMKGEANFWTYNNDKLQRVLIVYNPDIFYNFDEQVCKAFAEEITDMQVTIASVAATDSIRHQHFDLYVFCANTYNWRADKPITDFIKNYTQLQNKPVVAIILGTGSTQCSQKYFEKLIRSKGANLIASRSFWLMRPNDESRLKEKNRAVAVSMVHKWAKEINDNYYHKKDE